MFKKSTLILKKKTVLLKPINFAAVKLCMRPRKFLRLIGTINIQDLEFVVSMLDTHILNFDI